MGENPLNNQPCMYVASDGSGVVKQIQIGDFNFDRNEVSMAFGNPTKTVFERQEFKPETNRIYTVGWQVPGEITEIQRITFYPADGTSISASPQEIIDRVIQYRIEEELKMQDALEEILLAQIDNNPVEDETLLLSEDDIILSTGEKFSDFAARVGNDVRIEIVEDASDEDIRAGLAQAERNRLEIEARAKTHPQDARGLQGLLKDAFPKIERPDGKNLLNRLLQTTADTAQSALEMARSLSPKQARFAEAAALTFTALTTQFPQSPMEIQPDAVTVTSLANTNAQTTAQTEAEMRAEQQAQEQRCLQSISPAQMIDIRVNLFEQSQFYRDRVHSPIYSERARVIWVQMVADAVKEVWERDPELMMRHGYRDMDHLFRTQIFIAYAESKGNQFKSNSANPLVAGLYHISIETARSIIEKYDLRERYPDVFPDRRLQRSDLNRARISAILYSYISADDHRYLSHRLGENVSEAFPNYSPYIPHVNGGPTAYNLIRASLDRPTRVDSNGRRVLRTAVDIVGRNVANDNESLFYRTVRIYNGNEVTTAYIARLPEEAARLVRTRNAARSVDESLSILRERGQNQEGIESTGHPSDEAVRGAALATCGLDIAA